MGLGFVFAGLDGDAQYVGVDRSSKLFLSGKCVLGHSLEKAV